MRAILGQRYLESFYPLLWRKQNGRCHYCDCMMEPRGGHPNSRTIEHITPPCRGGLTYDVFNLALACETCNKAKGDLTEFEFAWFVVAFGRYPTAQFKLAYAIVCGHDKFSRTGCPPGRRQAL